MVLAAAAVAAVMLAYVPCLSGPFFADDILYVVGNQGLQDVPLAQPWRFFTTRTNPYEFLPFRDLSLRLDLALFGNEPLGYHLHNLLLYGLCCLAVWRCTGAALGLLSAAEGRRRGYWCAAVTALFAVHPAHVESVAWISGRKDLLSGLFALLSLWLFCAALSGPGRIRRLIASCLLFAVALGCKATVVPMVLVAAGLALAHYLPRGRTLPMLARAALVVLPLALIAAASLYLSMRVGLETAVRADPFTEEATRSLGRVRAAIRILGYLAGIALAPVRLRLMYDVLQPGAAAVLAYAAGAATLAGALAGAVALIRRRSMVGLGAVLFAACCLPYLQLIPFHTWSLASERFLFLATLGLALVLVGAVRRLAPRPRTGLLALLVAGGVALTAHQSGRWGDPAELIRSTARLSSGYYLAQLRLIDDVLLPAENHDAALKAASRVRLRIARRTLKRYVLAYQARNNGDVQQGMHHARWLARVLGKETPQHMLLLLGQLHQAGGEHFEAARYYYYSLVNSKTSMDRRRCTRAQQRLWARYAGRLGQLQLRVDREPARLEHLGALANLQLELFMLRPAEVNYRRLLRQSPGHPVAHYNLGLALLRMRRYEDAVADLTAGINAGIRQAKALNNLGTAHKEAGQLERAAAAYSRALALDQRHWHAAFNLGRMYKAMDHPRRARSAFLEARRRVAAAGASTALVDIYLHDLKGR